MSVKVKLSVVLGLQVATTPLLALIPVVAHAVFPRHPLKLGQYAV